MRFLTAILTVVLALIAAGCSGDSINAAEGAQRKILLVNNKDDPRWLDLHRINSVVESNIMITLFEGLVGEGRTTSAFRRRESRSAGNRTGGPMSGRFTSGKMRSGPTACR